MENDNLKLKIVKKKRYWLRCGMTGVILGVAVVLIFILSWMVSGNIDQFPLPLWILGLGFLVVSSVINIFGIEYGLGDVAIIVKISCFLSPILYGLVGLAVGYVYGKIKNHKSLSPKS